MTYLIGIDSGGTHIVGTAWQAEGQQLAQVTAGPGNIFLDQTQTLANLKTVIQTLVTQMAGQTCQHILIGIAGVETTGNADEVAAQLTAAFAVPVSVISDAQLALLNGLEGADGTLVIAGTGSIVYGRQNGQTVRFGGWGQLLGDTGSAYKISEAAMKQALSSYDRGQTSHLQTVMTALLGATTMPAAVRQYYQLSREAIAAFAAKIAIAAENGDADAARVLTEAATALGAEVTGLLARYADPAPSRLALSGSVLTHNQKFRETVIDRVRLHFPAIDPVAVTTNNSRGVIFWQLWAS